MVIKENNQWKSNGIRRLINALRYQLDGIRHGLLHDSAIRQIIFSCMFLVIVAIILPVARFERLLLILSVIFVVLMEFVNSALEAIIDRISLEKHPLSKSAKDYGSVAVAISALMALLCWLFITGPLLFKWFMS